jgi:hypothetical protein
MSYAGSVQAASSRLKHLELEVYEFEPPVRNGSSDIDAEETCATRLSTLQRSSRSLG